MGVPDLDRPAQLRGKFTDAKDHVFTATAKGLLMAALRNTDYKALIEELADDDDLLEE